MWVFRNWVNVLASLRSIASTDTTWASTHAMAEMKLAAQAIQLNSKWSVCSRYLDYSRLVCTAFVYVDTWNSFSGQSINNVLVLHLLIFWALVSIFLIHPRSYYDNTSKWANPRLVQTVLHQKRSWKNSFRVSNSLQLIQWMNALITNYSFA